MQMSNTLILYQTIAVYLIEDGFLLKFLNKIHIILVYFKARSI